MNSKILAAGVALAVFATGAAYAAPKAAAHADRGKTVAPPGQPIPYAQLDAYLKASPKQRQQILANASSTTMQSDASTTAPTSTSAAAPAAPPGDTPAAPDAAASSAAGTTGTTDAGAGIQSGAVNPAPASPAPTDFAAPASGGPSTDKQ